MEKVKELRNCYDERANYAQVKRDGYRLRIVKDNVGLVRVWTRRPKEWTALIKELPTAQTLWTRLESNCIIHAEVWRKDTPATSVITMVKAADASVKLSVFGVERGLRPNATLTEVSIWCKKQGLDFIPYYKRGIRDAGSLGSFTKLSDLPTPFGDIEGYVFKDYNDSNVGEGWQKWTPVKTITLVVSRIKPARKGSKYEGQVGSLGCSDLNGKELCAISGFNDTIRASLTESIVGQVVEVKYKNIASNGKLRMPRFKRWRDDIDCTQIDTLEGVGG